MAYSFLRTPEGRIHYQLSGPDDGPPIVLIHGFSTPLFVWDHTVGALIGSGMRVLRYDLFGRGLSDKPDVPNSPELFEEQLLNLLDGLAITGPVDLLGVSMGGAISVHFWAHHPERVRRVALVSPAGFPLALPVAASLVRLPVLGEVIVKLIGRRVVERQLDKNLFDPEKRARFMAEFVFQFDDPGYLPSILSTLRHMPLAEMAHVYRRAAENPRPTLLIWGEQDAIIPIGNAALVCQTLPDVTYHAIPNSGHISHYETPDAVNPLLTRFFMAG